MMDPQEPNAVLIYENLPAAKLKERGKNDTDDMITAGKRKNTGSSGGAALARSCDFANYHISDILVTNLQSDCCTAEKSLYK